MRPGRVLTTPLQLLVRSSRQASRETAGQSCSLPQQSLTHCVNRYGRFGHQRGRAAAASARSRRVQLSSRSIQSTRLGARACRELFKTSYGWTAGTGSACSRQSHAGASQGRRHLFDSTPYTQSHPGRHLVANRPGRTRHRFSQSLPHLRVENVTQTELINRISSRRLPRHSRPFSSLIASSRT